MSIWFSNIGMMTATMATVVGSYTLSLSVATERAAVDDVRGEIAANFKDIRALEAELRTRARLPQLERWNVEVLALGAPTSKQFADGPMQLVGYAPGASGEAAPQFAIGERPVVQTAVLTNATYSPRPLAGEERPQPQAGKASGAATAPTPTPASTLASLAPLPSLPLAQAGEGIGAGLTATLAAAIESAPSTPGFRTIAAR